jgi:hypothetical protein
VGGYHVSRDPKLYPARIDVIVVRRDRETKANAIDAL